MTSIITKGLKNEKEEIVQDGGLFIAIGDDANTSIFRDQVKLDDRGYIIVEDHTRTSVDGVFAAGDVHDDRYRQDITAAAFGAMAALDVEKWLTAESKKQQQSPTVMHS